MSTNRHPLDLKAARAMVPRSPRRRNFEADRNTLEMFHKEASSLPWHVVGPPWRPRSDHGPVSTYVVSGNPDPHLGDPVISGIDIDEWTEDEGWEKLQDRSDANLEFACFATEAIGPALDEIERLQTLIDRFTRALEHFDSELSTGAERDEMDQAVAALKAAAEKGQV